MLNVDLIEDPADPTVTTENPVVVMQDSVVDGSSVVFTKTEDATYKIKIKTLGNEKLNNKEAQESTDFKYVALVPATTIPVLGLSPKQARRGSAYLLYFKDGASAEDFLTRIGAPHAAMELMQAKVEKNLRNTINRQVNCETANMMKAADASARQIAAIQALIDSRGEDAFPGNLWETVRLRLEYPTDSLSELAQRFDPPISKPGLSHRLKKIIELAEKED